MALTLPDSPRTIGGYNRQVLGTGGITPNAAGYRALDDAIRRNAHDIEPFMASIRNFGETYRQIREERDIRDTDTMIQDTIRQRRLDVMSSRSGKGADGIVEDETDWMLRMRGRVVEESGLAAKYAGDMWDQAGRKYLEGVVGYSIQQNEVAERESKNAFIVSSQNNLAVSGVGDFSAYADYNAKVNATYSPTSPEAIRAKEQGIDVMFSSWVEQDPRLALQWFNQNKDDLRQAFGREFPDVAKVMERAENKLDAQARRIELNYARQARLADAQQRRIDKKWENDQMMLIATDDPDFSVNDVIRDGAENGISGNALYNILRVAESRETRELAIENAAEAKARRAELDSDRNARREEREETQRGNEWLQEQKLRVLDGDPTFIMAEVDAKAAEEGIPYKARNDLLEYVEKRGDRERKQTNANLQAVYYPLAAAGELTDDHRTEMRDAIANGTMLPSTYATIEQASQRSQKLMEEGLSEQYKMAIKHLRTAVAPRGPMDTVNQVSENRYEQLEIALYNYIGGLDSVRAKKDALDFSRDDSYINQLINANVLDSTSITRAREAYSMGEFDSMYRPILPQEQNDQVNQRSPGETIQEWKARTGL